MTEKELNEIWGKIESLETKTYEQECQIIDLQNQIADLEGQLYQ